MAKEKYIELCYLSPDWRVFSDERLQKLVEDDAMAILDIERKSLSWLVDKETEHKHLLVLNKDITSKRGRENIEYAKAYMTGFAFAIGYM